MPKNNDFSKQLVNSQKYVVRLAKTTEDLHNAQSLRYQVFNVELEEGLERSHKTELDVDKYDEQCDHLLVTEKTSGAVIGTYRMQTYKTAIQHKGFYTADEYHLENLPSDIMNKSVEVGRACIHKNHRNGRVLYLLWRGIAEYMKLTESRYLFGCCSITSTDPAQGWIVMDYLKNNGLVHQEFTTEVKERFRCPKVEYDEEELREVELPQLFKLYIGLGAKILSPPALDSEFKTIDYLILVDIMKLDERSKALFLK
ncbi:GNAT family N-acetyltransferase [Fodinibius halophilus]|uniref:GNAT family N-acetyltransferase n=1 Tax=Fodinibius halophilus TaxID=1736908 RepID=A0A6M1TH48_9BACT|nr:GNAT family N-acyltransferase [Fodinibius halophilus]NGP87980.1 GNAT family N-acetyltransferase [Fodinibius halophilus]